MEKLKEKLKEKAEIVAIIRKKTGRGLDSEKIAEILEMDPDYVKKDFRSAGRGS